MKFLKNNFKYIFIFFFAFFSMSFFLTYFDGDVLWNYGFSYAISRGEIPYLDFNMIITPLYPFLMSLILKINTNILFFYLENAFLITIIFYYLYKMFDYKMWFFLIFLVFPIPAVVFPSYNLFLILLFVLIFYFEKEKKNDYLIGFLIGLSFLTKQTVGFFLIIPSIMFYKDIKKIIKRGVGFLIPNVLFLITLLISKSLKEFFDLCLFGLFDFTSKNTGEIDLSLIIGLVLLLIIFILYLKNRKNIFYLYVLCFATIMIPLFDFPHIEYFFFVFLMLVVDKIKVDRKMLLYNSIIFSLAFVLIFFYFTTYQGKINYPNHYNNFNARLLYDKNGEDYIRDQIIKYIEENRDKEIVFLASDAYFYKITCNLDITYFDLINKGNHGYNGTLKIKRRLDQLKKGTILIIDTNETYSKRSNASIQFNREIAKYGIKISHKIENIAGYTIYEKDD